MMLKNILHDEPIGHSASKAWLSSALDWIYSMQSKSRPYLFRLHQDASPSVFSSCFALFCLHLSNQLSTWKRQDLLDWGEYIQAFQDERTGLFVDPEMKTRVTDDLHDSIHLAHQLTGYCLSALKILQSEAKYPIAHVKPWFETKYIKNWLSNLDWSNASNSGNKAMFVAIMLVHELERGEKIAMDGLDAWLEWHEKHGNPNCGFWGSNRGANYFQGMRGFVHQFIVFNYLDREYKFIKHAVDRILLLQQPDGLFSPKSGGGACDDLDAIHVLAYAYTKHGYRKKDIYNSLKISQQTLMGNQNTDGGFCWSQRKRFKLGDWISLFLGNFHLETPDLPYFAIREAIAGQLKLKKKIETGWSKTGRDWNQSSMWDTWFRMLALAEIDTALNVKSNGHNWQSIDFPNFGWFQYR